MADPFEAIGNIGQKALALPTEMLSVGTRRVTEDMGMFSAKIQDLGTVLIPQAGGLGLPQLPPLPGMAGQESAQAPQQVQTMNRSERVQGVRTARKTSYLRV